MTRVHEVASTYLPAGCGRPIADCTAWTDAQLLAVSLRSGAPGTPACALARQLLEQHGGLAGVLAAAPDALPACLGSSRRVALAAILELSRRAIEQQLREREVFGSPDAVKNYLQLHLARKPREEFAVLFLDAQNRLIAFDVMFRGTLTQTSVYPREIVAEALRLGAAAVVLAHNHPSGTVNPSRADEALTQTLKSALAMVDVRVLDHIIVAPGAALSMAEEGLV
ncbi:RadC family protein [Ramlibacter sp. AN1133]|uniref:RadC family protein n=1 Tax=Ramlibacter sp. AN1133 TaxID=3133429 RepID=UPI0030BFD76E